MSQFTIVKCRDCKGADCFFCKGKGEIAYRMTRTHVLGCGCDDCYDERCDSRDDGDYE